MNNISSKKIIILVIIVSIGFFAVIHRHCKQQNSNIIKIKTGQKVEDSVQLSEGQKKSIAKQVEKVHYDKTISTSMGNVDKVAESERYFRKADKAVIVGDMSKPAGTPVELKQYNIYAAPKVLRTVGVKVGRDKKSEGVSLEVKKRISQKGKYIGVRVDYDWTEKQPAVWATYSW